MEWSPGHAEPGTNCRVLPGIDRNDGGAHSSRQSLARALCPAAFQAGGSKSRMTRTGWRMAVACMLAASVPIAALMLINDHGEPKA